MSSGDSGEELGLELRDQGKAQVTCFMVYSIETVVKACPRFDGEGENQEWQPLPLGVLIENPLFFSSILLQF